MSEVFAKDTLRASVEAATGGKMTVMYDDKGYPCHMVVIPRFNLEDVEASGKLGTGAHPAFIVNDTEVPEIFIGAHQATVKDGRAVSLPSHDPATYINYDQARSFCAAKGEGWHLMTVHERSAVMLWCLANGFQPRGNTSHGKSHEAPWEHGKVTYRYRIGENWHDGRTSTGCGPASWRHDGTFQGISDLVGNVWEWIGLMKIVDGRIYCPDDNSYTLDEEDWPARDAFFDSPGAGDGKSTADLGEPILSDSITNYAGPRGNNGHYDYNYISEWKTLKAKEGWIPPLILKQLGVCPFVSSDETDSVPVYAAAKGAMWIRNYGERMPVLGGDWLWERNSGLAALPLTNDRSTLSRSIGFRPVFTG